LNRQKTNTEAMPFIIPKALEIIENYKTDPRSIRRDRIFPRYSLDKLNKFLKEITKLAGITKHITSHCGRHTFATMSIEEGINIASIKGALGHKSIKETETYARITPVKIERDYLNFLS